MKRIIQPSAVKFVTEATAFSREGYDNFIGTNDALKGDANYHTVLGLKHGADSTNLVAVDEALLKQIIQVDASTGNFGLNLEGLDQFVEFAGQEGGFLNQARDVSTAAVKPLPVPANVGAVKPTNSTRI